MVETTPPIVPSRTDRTSLAIALTLAAMLAFAVMDGLSKLVLQTLPIPQVMWVRNIVFTAVALALVRTQHPTRRLRHLAHSDRPGLQFGRALLLMVESAMFMLAFRLMPIADVHARQAASPLLVVALSVVILGEKVGPRRWTAVLIGFIGVLLIVRPGVGVVSMPMLIALAATALWAIYQILVRIVSRTDASATTSLWTALVGLGVTSTIGPLVWVWPDAQSWALLTVIALLGATAHCMLIAALGMTNTANIQPYTYTLFVWAVIVGYVMFGDMPDRWTLGGAAVIIASGVYVWYRERVRSSEARTNHGGPTS